MSAYDYAGAEGHSYPEIAARAVQSVYQQNPSPVYGYLRADTQQKIYLFPSLEDARGWITVLIHGQQPYDYAAVFAATDLTRPVPGLERFGPTHGPEEAHVAGFFDDLKRAAKGTFSRVASFVHHPPGWFATIFPLMTMENQRYWAKKLGGSTGAQLYDTGVKAMASKYLGPQGPQLVETYNKVADDAARGNVDAKEILANAPQIAKLAAASKQGPEAFQAAVAETGSAVKVSGAEGERDMSGYDYVGADGHSYPEIASRAVMSVQQQNPSPVYGYLRMGAQQKIYLYQTLGDAHGWFTSLTHGQEPHDYAAVFVATDLTRPVPGLESFGHARVSGYPEVGNWLPLLLGVPAGGALGYFLRKWQEENPGQAIPGVPPGKLPAPHIPGIPPKTSGDWIGGSWLDIVGQDPDGYSIGGPWLDIVGSQGDDRVRARAWPQTKALIQSAIKEVTETAPSLPGTAYVWSLDPPSASPSYSPSRRIVLEGTTGILSFGSTAEAIDYMRERIQTPHVALALFERTSQHWPNPTSWTKSDDPAYEPVIAAQAAKATPTRSAGDYVGAYPWQTTIGSAVDDVRTRAQSIANKRAGSVVGVVHTTKDGLWHALAFRNADDADDWLGTATQDPAGYTYAAYYDKEDFQWPHPVNEKIGGARVPSKPGSLATRGSATTSGNWRAA